MVDNLYSSYRTENTRLCCVVSCPSFVGIRHVSPEFDAASCCPPAHQPPVKMLQLRCSVHSFLLSNHLRSMSILPPPTKKWSLSKPAICYRGLGGQFMWSMAGVPHQAEIPQRGISEFHG